MRAPIAAIFLFLSSPYVLAGSLPPPTRTVYKCEEGKSTYYSDSPCLGATKVDVTPTRGLNKLSGREQTGTDVRREKTREQFAEALRPLTGMNSEQFDQAGRRMQLSANAQQECRSLDGALPIAENAERTAHGPEQIKLAQARLFSLRTKYRELRCE